ncbi:TIR domain-containing protein [Roseiconus lacunae]|uniref:TIR domain-containing protein n=1 Tax=Roseiconus lacunae TaxID=2605694 RepID=UPI001E3C04F4|nr:TIR domain-containing protein [Roseiconus lacunae]MCD0460691.1 TIR domain-containing protein [Roseiconus lacunae]
MTRRAFYSFEYLKDNWRASQVRQMGVIEGNINAISNEWEEVALKTDAAIKKWIDGQMTGKGVVIVLIGASTSGRKYIDYEIETGWNAGKGLLGVHVHNLKDSDGKQTAKGANPFAHFRMQNDKRLSDYAAVYDPPYSDSKAVYKYINDNLPSWIEAAVNARKS